ncbi:MAG: FixH family protein [Polyangiaceae bacterium]
MKTARALFVLPLLLAASCSSGSSSGDAADAAAPPALCATDSRAQTYASGLEEKGASGAFDIKLMSINPNPAFKGNNAWTIQVVDASGAPVTGATIKVNPYMPDHGHGSSITPQIAAGRDPGTYDITLLNLFMPGIWTVTIVVTNAGITDQSVFTFCIGE